MRGPVHFDIAEFERNARAGMAATFAEADEAIAAGIADKPFVMAQREFSEARIQCALACARASNSGVPHEMVVAAAGTAIGGMIGSLFSTLTELEQAEFWQWAQRSMTGILDEDDDDGNRTTVSRIEAPKTEGGHA